MVQTRAQDYALASAGPDPKRGGDVPATADWVATAPVLMKHVCSSVYVSELCRVCGSERATAAHILWDCVQNPRAARIVTTIPPWLATAAGNDQLEEQTRAVQWISAALEKQRPSENAKCPLPPQHRGRQGCQKKAGVAKAARRVEGIMPK
ncbi:hypothetical protein HPB50_026256 [Hyalomma asiaticum]|uniref:Uncharacterized protein n=1 Tax=Hyalomma asiaticum TaxID=266040 RepID=A0ACB7SLH6_HYAAI|nr:hypothetical protein HPB50_026256 [Hyalomma asiaticum]